MTWQEFLASSLEMGGNRMKVAILTTPEAHQSWCPPGIEGAEARNALDLCNECIELNWKFAAPFAGTTPSEYQPSKDAKSAADNLEASTAALANVVRSLDESALTNEFELPWGKAPGKMILQIANLHLAYHAGQLNYIQTLYGDKVFHRTASES